MLTPEQPTIRTNYRLRKSTPKLPNLNTLLAPLFFCLNSQPIVPTQLVFVYHHVKVSLLTSGIIKIENKGEDLITKSISDAINICGCGAHKRRSSESRGVRFTHFFTGILPALSTCRLSLT